MTGDMLERGRAPSTAALARAAGVSEAALYRHFASKAQMFEALIETGRELASDRSVRAVVLSGEGRAFCAGLDLKDWGTPPEPGQHPHMDVGTDAQTFMSNLTVHMRDTPQVIIAAVNGPAYGGGLALACAADIRLAGASARMSP